MNCECEHPCEPVTANCHVVIGPWCDDHVPSPRKVVLDMKNHYEEEKALGLSYAQRLADLLNEIQGPESPFIVYTTGTGDIDIDGDNVGVVRVIDDQDQGWRVGP